MDEPERLTPMRGLEIFYVSPDRAMAMHLTSSAGLTAIRLGYDWHSLFQRADRALFLAKIRDRDRTAIAA